MQQLNGMERSDKIQKIISKSLPFIWQYGTLLTVIALGIIFIILDYVPYTKEYSYRIKIDNQGVNQYIFSSINNDPLPTLYQGQRIWIAQSDNSKPDYDFYIDDIECRDTCHLTVLVTINTQNIHPDTYDIIISKTEEPVLRKVLKRR